MAEVRVKKKEKRMAVVGLLLSCALLAACGNGTTATSTSTSGATGQPSSAVVEATSTGNSDYFKDSDFDASYDASTASSIQLSGSSATVSGKGVSVSGSTVTISAEGTYIISGTSEDVQILVNASDTAKVQLVLDGVVMSGSDALIAVEEADKVTVTLAEGSQNELTDSTHTTDTYSAAIYSRSDLVFNGTGSLTVNANYNNAIKGNDDVRFTGGTYTITSTSKHAISANDALNITGVTMELTSAEDALHSDNDEDTSLGNLYIESGNITINAGDDAIHATNDILIAGGTIDIQSSVEGIEGKNIYINDGVISIQATDDGINATDWTVTTDSMVTGAQEGVGIYISGGDITINMAQGDTDAVDSNGDLTISGGTMTISAQSAFDFDGSVSFTGGTVTVNGEQLTEISNSMMMGGVGPGGVAPGGNAPAGGGGTRRF